MGGSLSGQEWAHLGSEGLNLLGVLRCAVGIKLHLHLVHFGRCFGHDRFGDLFRRTRVVRLTAFARWRAHIDIGNDDVSEGERFVGLAQLLSGRKQQVKAFTGGGTLR